MMTVSTSSALQRRQISVVMCDLVDFTAITEHTDPEDLAEGMHAYRQLCTATIEEHVNGWDEALALNGAEEHAHN